MTDEPAPRSRGGRPRDATRDAAILTATLEVLAEHGYERMTMDQVARRAGAGKATLYRRWPSKADLVVQAVAQFDRMPTLGELPDTGDLRGDLLALMRPQSAEDEHRTLALASGMASLLSADPALADAAGSALVEPFVASQRLLIRRAIDRGEVRADVDVETVAFVTPSMTAFRLIVQRKPIDTDLLARLVDAVILPACGLRPGEH
ncbi:TetR/AcrR family transcriptional regulator [Actinomycetospora termitidis]|uniref:TetR/AcrR family transcriptional regulator n=1 Tax=Actinomycetospora termitidis TaxID=3053470 RepID=A0ABT7MDM2_9PSEU|nr:TetR/AcrR family transcriptional regulator [Actinomycetospora sp. Odt1-22]MDL5158766.1 TetR/AcrR family transcriptional regulator [Actinomycetospora sp. Odt1-22]